MSPAVYELQNGHGQSLVENKVSSIPISEQERLSGIPSQATVGAAVSTLFRDGIVVLENAVSLDHIRVLNDKLVSEVPGLVEDPNTHWNGGKDQGNISQPPPMSPKYMFADVWANPFATAVVSAILGPRPHVNYVNGNTALPNTHGRQKVHADLTFPYPSHMPFAMVANYYLCDTDESNGATEVWLRSHNATSFRMHEKDAAWIQSPYLETRVAESGFPPIRPTVKAGSVVIRDLRLWHAGRSNPSDIPRIMLAFVYFPWWYQNKLRIKLPEEARPLLESVSSTVVYDADFISGDVDHTKLHFDANFESKNEAYNATISERITPAAAEPYEGEEKKLKTNGKECNSSAVIANGEVSSVNENFET